MYLPEHVEGHILEVDRFVLLMLPLDLQLFRLAMSCCQTFPIFNTFFGWLFNKPVFCWLLSVFELGSINEAVCADGPVVCRKRIVPQEISYFKQKQCGLV